MRKSLRDRLILVDIDPPVYESAQRYRCTDCKNLFDLSEHDVVERAKCRACREPLFSRVQMQKMWKAAESLLQRARKLERMRRQLRSCPHCDQPVSFLCWCPLHDAASARDANGGLPQNPTLVWVRTFQTAESLDELQSYEGRQQDEADDEWMLNETETTTVSEERNRHAPEHDG